MIAIPVKIYWSDQICGDLMEYDIHGKYIYISDDLPSTHGSICAYHNGYIVGDDYRDIRGVTVFCTVDVLYRFVAIGNHQVGIQFKHTKLDGYDKQMVRDMLEECLRDQVTI